MASRPYAILPIFASYAYVFIAFILFLLLNKGIVMGLLAIVPAQANLAGDRNNHIAGFNIPQMFYCATVVAGFGAPLLLSLPYVRRFFRSCVFGYGNLLNSILVMGILLVIVHYNTYLSLQMDHR